MVAAAALAVALLREFQDQRMFILFAAPIALSAWYGGRGPALLAMLLGLVVVDVLFFEHVYVFLPSDLQDILAMGVYILVGLVIVHLSDLLRSARDDAQRYAHQLEDANEALKASTSAQLAEAQALASLGSWEWNVQENRISWSDEMFRLFGFEPGSIEIDYERYQSLLHPDDRPIASEIVANSLRTGEPFSYDHRVIRTDGEVRILHARGNVTLDADGKPVRMFGTGQDVTERRRADAALRSAAEYAAKQATIEAAARHLNRVLSQAPVLMAVLDGPEHRFEMINEKGASMIGESDVIGRTLREALPHVSALGFGALLDNVYSSGEPFVGSEVFASLSPEGEGGYFNFVFQPLSDENAVYAVLVVATDVSDLVSARLAAEKSQREAMAASRSKSDFLARMSHELRTPLSAIIGYGELLSDGITGPVNDEQVRQLNRIRSSANHLLSIIEEILTLARMEVGKEKVNMRKVDVTDLMESVATMTEPLAAAKGLSFQLEVVKPGLTIETDPVKLRQVMLNLITNAVNYTERGSVTVAGKACDGEILFVVKDTGVGVSEEHLEKIFEPFWQVEQTTTRRVGGTGLGLAVTRQFVELLGGRISVSSRLGKGSTFTVALPAEPGEK